EIDETVVITLISPIRPLSAAGLPTVFGYQIGEPASATVTITDNDLGHVPLPTVDIKATVPEASEVGPVSGQFVISRLGDTKEALTVQYEILTDPIAWPDDLSGDLVNFPIFLLPAADTGVD